MEHAFGILSNRFRVLLTPLNSRNAETVEVITLACCVLHNFLLEGNNDYINEFANCPTERYEKPAVGTQNPRKAHAENMRQQFLAYFNNEGKVEWI